MAASAESILRFGAFEADLSARELRKHGLRLKLQEQPFQVLVMLLERPGEIVTREQLRQKLWRVETFVGFDHRLNNAVNRLARCSTIPLTVRGSLKRCLGAGIVS